MVNVPLLIHQRGRRTERHVAKRYTAQVSDTTMMTIAASLFGQKINHT